MVALLLVVVVVDVVVVFVGVDLLVLSVVVCRQGVVVGRIQFRDDGDLIDCTRMGVGGKAIPPYIDRITEIQSDADFILLVEKDAAFMRLAEDRYYSLFRTERGFGADVVIPRPFHV